MAKRRQKLNMQPFWRFLFVAYCAVMLWLLFGRSFHYTPGIPYRQLLRDNVNVIPFYTIDNYMNILLHYPNAAIYRHCLVNIVGNIVMFLPAGFLIPKVFPALNRYLRFFLTAFMAITVVESVQLFTLLGFFDVDDLILNLVGMTLGFVIYACFRKK